MRPNEFHKYIQRDQHCLHCGSMEQDLVPHHRANRGMGGSKIRDVPSNIIVMCARFNGEMESLASAAALARDYGWKLSNYENPLIRPVYDAYTGEWHLLNNNYQKQRTSNWTLNRSPEP